jgi:hypothetical protein
VDPTILSRASRGERTLPHTYPDLLDQVVALGDRNGARRPVYVFGHVGRKGDFAQVLDDEGRVGFLDWKTRQLARDVAAMLREVPGWRTLAAVPAWPRWLVDRPAVQLDERIIGVNAPDLSDREVATLAAADVLAFLGAVARHSDKKERAPHQLGARSTPQEMRLGFDQGSSG